MAEQICPHCKQSTYDDEALLCHFCGESLGRTSRGALGKMTGASAKWLFAAVAVILIISFLLLFW